ncbi:hypothetical protein [Actinopolymorpha pittospori]
MARRSARPGSSAPWEVCGVLAATSLLAGLLCAWSVLTPAYRPPDEAQHLSTALRLATGGGYPPHGQALMDPAVLASYRWVGYTGPRVQLTPRPPALAEPPSMASLRAPGLPRPATSVDQMTQHPPGYYALLAAAINGLGLDGASPQAMILVLRLLSAALLLPVPLLCFLAARRLGLPPPVGVVAAFLPAAWVQFTHIGASINNGTLTVLASSLAVVLLLPIAQGDVRARRALAAGGAVTLALLTKGFGLALLPTVAVAYVGAVRAVGARKALPSAVVAAAAILPGTSWWLFNIVRYGQLQPSRPPGTAWSKGPADLAGWAGTFLDFLAWTMWGALGSQEGRPPRLLYIATTVVLVVLLAVGSWILRRQPVEVILLHSGWLGPLTIITYGSAREFLITGTVRGAQGRYLQVAVVSMAVLALAPLVRTRLALVLGPVMATLLGAGGLLLGFWLFWGTSAGAGRFESLTSWSPGATAVMGLAAVTITGAAVLGVVALVRLLPARQSSASTEPAAPGARAL